MSYRAKQDDSNPEHPFKAKPSWANPHRSLQARQSLSLSLNSSVNGRPMEGSRGSPSEGIETAREPGQEIYFNTAKKYNYMKLIIDKYFEEGKQRHRNGSELREDTRYSKTYQTVTPKIQMSEDRDEVKGSRKRRLSIHRKGSSLKEEDEGLGETMAQTMVQSRVMFSDNESIDTTRSLFFTRRDSSLPPIDQTFEDRDGELNITGSISYLNETQIEQPETRVILMENEAYRIELMKSKGSKDKGSYHIKTYYEKGTPIMIREKKAQQLGVESVWVEYKYDHRAMVKGPSCSLKDMLYKAKRIDLESKFFTLKPQKYHRKLISNSCEELMRVLVDFCESMKAMKGRVVNNKINTGNLYLVKNENWRVGEWGFASFRESHLIQGREFENRLEPILKTEREWLVTPEYMAPEILRAISLGEDSDLMALGAAPDIWSLGVAIFQILTLIPVWITQKCVVQGKPMASRSGVLAIPNRDPKKMLKRQQKLGYLMGKIIEEECMEQEFNPSLLSVMYKCVEYEPLMRPSYDEIILALK